MIDSALGLIRKVLITDLFIILQKHVKGDVLDIGGGSFFSHVIKDKKISFETWTCLEPARKSIYNDPRYRTILGDGEETSFTKNSFDTILNIQVLEHTLHPEKMVKEIVRLLKPKSYAIFLIPQTSALHQVPTHYYNFTKYWIENIFPANGLEIVELKPLGGRWRTHASHMLHVFLEAFRVKGFSSPEYRRNTWFYLFLPLMMVYAALGIVIGLVFSIGDLKEDPNNLLVLARKV